MNAAQHVRRKLLRRVAPTVPGVHIEQVWDSSRFTLVLLVVATGKVRCKIDGRPAADLNSRLFLYDGQRVVRHRVAGVFIAAMYAVDGMLVQTGREHFVVAGGALARLDRRAHEYLLGLHRGADAVGASTGVRIVRPTNTQTTPSTNSPWGAS